MTTRKIMAAVFLLASGAAWTQTRPGGTRTEFRTPQDAVYYYENLIGRLTRQVRSMQDDNALLVAANTELKQRVAHLETEFGKLNAEVAALRKQIAADAEARKNQLKSLADKLAMPAPEKTSVPGPVSATGRTPVPADRREFIEHTVEPGTTLTALAKAYGVTVKDIERANHLTSPTIYAGQKLLIPAVKKP